MARPAMYDVQVFPSLTLTRAQLLTADWDELRGLGAGQAMIEQALALVRLTDASLLLDFERQTVNVVV